MALPPKPAPPRLISATLVSFCWILIAVFGRCWIVSDGLAWSKI
jgi:hypothetical protein